MLPMVKAKAQVREFFSPTIEYGALRAVVIRGKESTVRRRAAPLPDHAALRIGRPPAAVIGRRPCGRCRRGDRRFRMFADKGINFVIALQVSPGLDLVFDEG